MMKDSEIYLRAAERIYDEMSIYSCVAIFRAAKFFPAHDRVHCCPQVEYENLFKPHWGGAYWGNKWSADADERRNCRVLALLFMHQIALDEERRKK